MTNEKFSAWDWTVLIFLLLLFPVFVLDLLGSSGEQAFAGLFIVGVAGYGIVKYIRKLIRTRRHD